MAKRSATEAFAAGELPPLELPLLDEALQHQEAAGCMVRLFHQSGRTMGKAELIAAAAKQTGVSESTVESIFGDLIHCKRANQKYDCSMSSGATGSTLDKSAWALRMTSGVGLELPSIGTLKEWGCGCLDFNQEQLVACTVMMLRDVGCEQVSVDITKAANFFGEIYSLYNKVPYHNMYHAFNVLQSCYSALQHPLLAQFPTEEKVAMLVAAAGHDVAHGGTTAAFHMLVGSELSMHYNDKSVLESMHAAHTFTAMRAHDGKCDLMAGMELEKKKPMRKMIIDAILATDMALHQGQMEQLRAVQGPFNMLEKAEREFMMQVIVHTADIAHPTFSWLTECRWARLVATEFQAQVDRERAGGFPPTLFMEYGGKQQLGKGQLGFIDFLVQPLFKELRLHVPEMQLCLDNLAENRKKFANVAEGSESMIGNEKGEDDDMMFWSRNVGFLALGIDNLVMRQAKPVTALMSDAGQLMVEAGKQDWEIGTFPRFESSFEVASAPQ